MKILDTLWEILQAIWILLHIKWYWIIVGISFLVLFVPFLSIMLFLILPWPFNTLALIGVIIGWGIAAGYKDWIVAKIKEENVKSEEES